MPDYTIPLQVRPQNTMQTLGELINFARGATELQKARATMQADIEQRKSESERAGIETGVARQTAQPRIEQQQATTRSAQTAAKAAAFKLEGDQSAKAMQIASGLVQDQRIQGDDPNGIIDAANEAYQQMVDNGVPRNKADFWASQIKAQAHQPGGALRLLSNVTRSAAGPGTTASVINAPLSPVQTQQGTVFAQTQPGAPGAVAPIPANTGVPGAPAGGTRIPVGVAPTQAEQPGTDALGRPILMRRDQAGNISYAPPPGSSYKPLMTLPPGETPQTAGPLLQLRDAAQSAAASAPAQHFNNRQILDLADNAFTGTGGQGLAKVMNAYGLQSTNDAGADTAKLQHFIALQIENNAKAQGASTDQARNMAAAAVLPTDSPAKAIKAITKINDAYATGAEMFNKGVQATLANPGNTKDIFAIRDFQNQWTQNMDPRIFQLENAVKAGDKGEVAKIKAALGDAGMKQLLFKARNLQRLVSQGAVNGP